MKVELAKVAVLFAALLALPAFGQTAHTSAVASPAGSEIRQVELVLKQQFDRPEAPLTVKPVSIVGNYALAGWIQGQKGGRALLQKEHGKWSIAVCGGDGLTQAKILETTGMAASVASQLAKAAMAAEAKLSAEQRRLLSSFEGVVKVDAHHGGHP